MSSSATIFDAVGSVWTRLARLRANVSLPGLRPAKAQEPAGARSMWAVIWAFAKPFRWWLLLGIGLNAIHGVAISLQTLLPTYIIDHVVMAKGVPMTARVRELAWLLGAYLAASIFMRMLMWHLSYRVFTSVRERVVFDLRAAFFRHVNNLCLRFHARNPSGELFNYLFGTPLGQVQAYFNHVAMFVPGCLFALVWTLVWVGSWDWLMCMILITAVLATVCQMRASQQQMGRLWSEYQKVEGKVSGHVADLIRGARHVKLYGIEGEVIREFESQVGAIRKQAYDRDVRSHVESMKQETLGYLCFAGLCAAGVWRYTQGILTVGQLQGYFASYFALQWPLQVLFQMATLQGSAKAAFERIEGVLQTASTTPDPRQEDVHFEVPVPEEGELTLDHVSFSYSDGKRVLDDISLTIPYGQHVALVGPSGGGKSTLSQLLLRLYDPDQGSIALGGVDLRDCLGVELRKRFGVVPQDAFIFRTTIRQNLRIVRPDASDGQILEACRLANALEFIEQLPQGLDTPVGENGSSLSGGQRQRLAIARALLANPAFFILDEATSALDSRSEQFIKAAVESALRGRTALIIAHRLATVKHCDRILVLSGGRIVQDGTFAELVGQEGLFQELVSAQQLRD